LALDDRRREVDTGGLGEFLAELVAQHPRRDLAHRAFLEVAELKRTERHANEPRDLQPEMAQHIAHLTVLALTNRKRDPHIGALIAIERGLDRSVVDAVDRHAVAQLIELVLRDLAVRTYPIAPQPRGRGQLECAGEPAVIG